MARPETIAPRHGCTIEQMVQLKAIGREMLDAGVSYRKTPLGAFTVQRLAAHTRGVGWELSLWQWWNIWKQSGHWHERGRDTYVMCRKGDEGPYAVGNVYIETALHNHSVTKKRHTTLPSGVSFCVQKDRVMYTARRTIKGTKKTKYLGTFPTPELAHAAFLQARAA